MKELSIEEKAKRYDEAIERGKSLLSDNKIGNAWIYKLLPELAENKNEKESEDERIRKQLKAFIHSRASLITQSKHDSWIAWLEKQGEQKPTDKIEPKFHEGDWVVSKLDGKARQISEVHCDEYNEYYIVEGNGYDIKEYDRLHYLWTIQDAKDGDVLAGHETIVIFKKIDGLNIKCYCTYHFMNFTSFYLDTLQSKDSYTPATKGQRDLLFQRIHDAGYEWDADKKELKKIEQKPAEWEPQTGDTFRKKGTTCPTYHLCNKREDGITFGFVENCEVGIAGGEITIFALKNDYELVERLKSIEDVVEKELNKELQTIIEQKPADKVEPKFKVGDIVKHKDNPHLTYILKRFTDDGDYEFHAIGKDGHEGCTRFSVVKCQDEWELVEQKPVEN